MGALRNEYKIVIAKPKWKEIIWGLDIDGMIVLKRIIRKLGMRTWNGVCWLIN
jgi:hypothetical protein